MKKLLGFGFVFLLMLVLIPFIGFALYAGDLFFYDFSSDKAGKAAQEYLEERYKQDFVIKSSKYTKALGDKHGLYTIKAVAKADKDLVIQLEASEDKKILSDDYKDLKWRKELNDDTAPFMKEVCGEEAFFNYAVNVSIPEKIRDQFSHEHAFSEIYSDHHGEISQYLFVNIVLDKPFDPSIERARAYKLYDYMKKKQLKDFSISIRYYPDKEISKKGSNYFKFEDENWEQLEKVFNFDTRGQTITVNSAEELDQFFK